MSRRLLHKTKLNEFKDWLDKQEIEHRAGNGLFQVMQVKVKLDWLAVYSRIDMKEHFTNDKRMDHLVAKFCRDHSETVKPNEIEQLKSRITQLETELAAAKKDQARYHWMQDWIENRVKGTKEFFKAKTRSDFDTSIDAAIKEQGK